MQKHRPLLGKVGFYGLCVMCLLDINPKFAFVLFHICYLTEWNDYVHSTVALWENFHIDLIKHGRRLMMVYYEDLQNISLLKKTLTKITEFSKFPHDKKRLKCVLKHTTGMFRRKKRCLKEPSDPEGIDYGKLNNTEIYTIEQKTRINVAIKNVYSTLTKHGHMSNHLLSYRDTSVKISLCKRKRIYQA